MIGSVLDILFDVYSDTSINGQTRENRGVGVRISIRKETPILKNFKQFLRNNENKTELFYMLNHNVASFSSETLFVVTKDKNLIPNHVVDW